MAKRVCPNGHPTKDDKALLCPQCGAELPAPPKRRPILRLLLAGIGVLLLLCILSTLVNKPQDATRQAAAPAAEATMVPASDKAAQAAATAPQTQPTAKTGATAKPTMTPKPTATTRPSRTPRPTETPAPPTPTFTPAPTPSPIDLKGTGQTATDEVVLPAPISVAHFTHKGGSNFAVFVYRGDEKDLLINEIGAYDGVRPLAGGAPVVLSIDADGPWTVHIEPVGLADSPAFAGKGDDVSGLFDPPKTGAWEFKHDGKSNFAVFLHCAGGSDLIQNEIGAVSGSAVIRFGEGPCLWEVTADGAWTLKPRP